MTLDCTRTVVVLDLDDTLYREADYHASGLKAVCARVETLYGKSVSAALADLERRGERDLFGAVCHLVGVASKVKDSLLWIYRLHAPSIALGADVKFVLQRLEYRCSAIAVLTDGRSITQRQKLKALGLAHLPLYISEEFGSEKPAEARFEMIMRSYPADTYVYVGDNPRKDFVAPNKLGWNTVGLRGDERNIHSQACEGLSPEMLPEKWINDLTELLGDLHIDNE